MDKHKTTIKLIQKYQGYVHGYVGSSMLTNTEYPELILERAQKLCKQVVQEIIDSMITTKGHLDLEGISKFEYDEDIKFWERVQKDIDKVKQEDL